MHVVVFTLGGERYALPIARVQEVIRHAHPRPVGSRIPFVAGVIELRGRIVPVCDIAARVGARASRSEQQKIVIVDLPGGQAGVLVDAVDEVVTVPDAQLAPVPAEVRTTWLRAIARLGDELVMVLDPERLLQGVVDPPVSEPVAVAEPVAVGELVAEPIANPAPAVEPTPEAKPARRRAARQPAAKTAAKAAGKPARTPPAKAAAKPARTPAARAATTTAANAAPTPARKPAARKTAAKSAARETAAKPAARKTAAKSAARTTAAKSAARKPAAPSGVTA